MKRRYIIAVLLMCMQLTACVAAGENGAETGTSEISSSSETVETAETTGCTDHKQKQHNHRKRRRRKLRPRLPLKLRLIST